VRGEGDAPGMEAWIGRVLSGAGCDGGRAAPFRAALFDSQARDERFHGLNAVVEIFLLYLDSVSVNRLLSSLQL
jgi:hypothetical protein